MKNFALYIMTTNSDFENWCETQIEKNFLGHVWPIGHHFATSGLKSVE